MKRWRILRVDAFTGVCPHCGADLLAGSDCVSWAQPEGVDEALAETDFCPSCEQPISERGYERAEDRDE